MLKATLTAITVALGATVAVQATYAVDAGVPAYTKGAAISGSMNAVGSDSLENLMVMWGAEIKKQHPSVNFQVEGKGSSTAPPALTQGSATFGPMSRTMKDDEVQAFEKKYGYKPTAVPVAVDALAVFVHKDNPVKGLSISMIDAIFGKSLKCGYPKAIKNWTDAGSSGPVAGKAISLYGRNSASGTYGFFKEHALCKGDFSSDVKEQPGSSAVVQAVATNIAGIGYSGIGYATSGVRAIPVKGLNGGDYVKPTAANALNGTYPLARYLYIYINKAPGKPLPANQAEFLNMVLSKDGQTLVEKDGYIALPAAEVKKARAKLGL